MVLERINVNYVTHYKAALIINCSVNVAYRKSKYLDYSSNFVCLLICESMPCFHFSFIMGKAHLYFVSLHNKKGSTI